MATASRHSSGVRAGGADQRGLRSSEAQTEEMTAQDYDRRDLQPWLPALDKLRTLSELDSETVGVLSLSVARAPALGTGRRCNTSPSC
jgi:hypothetical protein